MKRIGTTVVAVALLGALAAGTAWAALTPAQKVQVLELKIQSQQIKEVAAKGGDSAKTPESRQAFKAIMDRLDDIYAKLEDILTND